MPRLVAAPDKFRGTATAREVTRAILAAADAAGWSATGFPMSDGGEGFCEAMGGESRASSVTGPLGERTIARWALRDDGTAILEAAEAAGRALVPRPTGDDPVDASTRGVGELVAAALGAGATSLVVGCGGTATTDGGAGCLAALDALGVDVRVPITVACDVDATFIAAAARFGPQKGASTAQVADLEVRLSSVAAAYRERFGVDVTTVPGSGAAGGLAGLLVALGGAVVAGATLVASTIGLEAAVRDADLVVTGEGRVDEGTLEGKVVRVVLELDADRPAIVVAGEIDDGSFASLAAGRPGSTRPVVLDHDLQRRRGTPAAITDAVMAAIAEIEESTLRS